MRSLIPSRVTPMIGAAIAVSALVILFAVRAAPEHGMSALATDAAEPAMAPAPARGFGREASAKIAGNSLALSDATGAQAPSLPATSALDAAAAMLIRSGTASVQVDSLASAMARVRELARRLGGVVGNVSVESGRDQVPSATLELRIPATRFDEAVEGLRPLGTVESVNVSSQDVGEEFVDVGARLANARRLEERLVALLATRTARLSDVVSVERELARVREEIERYEGRMRYLRAHVATSTLAITVHEPPPIAAHPGARPIAQAFVQAWRNLVALTAWTIASLGVLVPVAVVAALIALVVRRRGRRVPGEATS